MAHKQFQLTAVAIALLSLTGFSWAQDAEVLALTQPDSSVTVGVGSWSGTRHQGGVYDAKREGGGNVTLDADVVQRDNATGTWIKFNAQDVGLENGAFKGEYQRQGDFGASLEYDRISRDDPNTYTTRLRGIGSATLTASTVVLPSPVQTIKLGTDREITSLGLSKILTHNLDLSFSFRNEEKTGTRLWGRGSASEFAVEPIDSTTQQMELALNYATKTWQLSGGYNFSQYDNQFNLVKVTSAGLPFSNTNPVNPTYLSVPLDNQAQQVFLNGGYNFSPTTRATFKLEYATATQDDTLATSSIPGLGYVGVPSSLQGKVETTLYQLALTARPLKDLSLLANLRYHQVDDKTPIVHFVLPAAGCTALTTCVDNTPLGFKTLSGKLEGTYRLNAGDSLTAGVEQRTQDRVVPTANTFGTGGTDKQRVVPFRTQLDELTSRLEFRRSLSETLNGSVSYSNARRTGSSYVFVAPNSPGNGANGFVDVSNLINPLNVADRERNKVRLSLDWAATESLSLQFNVEEGRDGYDSTAARPFGLHDGTMQFVGLDASYAVNDRWKINAWYSYDFSQAKQTAARPSNSGGDAAVANFNLEDIGNALGLGIKGELSSSLSMGADLEVFHNLSKYQQTLTALAGTPGTNTVPNFTQGLPDIVNKSVRLNLFAKYAIDKKSDVRVDLGHEIWSTNDWSWMYADGTPYAYPDGNSGTSAGTNGTTVTANQNQTNDYVSVRYTYKF